MVSTTSKTFSGKLFSNTEHIVNEDGQYLFCKYWRPHKPLIPKFLVFMLHGFGGHCGRFEELATHFNAVGGFAFAHDHVGHGESEGIRTTIKDYRVYIRDAFQHIYKIRKDFCDLPVFLFGQSMGGALAVLAANERPGLFKGVIILGGMLLTDPAMAPSYKKLLVRFAGNAIPMMQVSTLNQWNGTRDKEEVEAVLKDPLCSSKVTAQMALQLLHITEAIENVRSQFTPPFIAVHGGADAQCDAEGARLFYHEAKSVDKILKVYEGCYHDLTHETESDRLQCIQDIVDWVVKRYTNMT